MIENSLDAGATSIAVVAKDGGLKHLSISDNGHGVRYALGGLVGESCPLQRTLKQASGSRTFHSSASDLLPPNSVILMTSSASEPLAFEVRELGSARSLAHPVRRGARKHLLRGSPHRNINDGQCRLRVPCALLRWLLGPGPSGRSRTAESMCRDERHAHHRGRHVL